MSRNEAKNLARKLKKEGDIRLCSICEKLTSFERHDESYPPEGEVCIECQRWICEECLDWKNSPPPICKECSQEK